MKRKVLSLLGLGMLAGCTSFDQGWGPVVGAPPKSAAASIPGGPVVVGETPIPPDRPQANAPGFAPLVPLATNSKLASPAFLTALSSPPSDKHGEATATALITRGSSDEARGQPEPLVEPPTPTSHSGRTAPREGWQLPPAVKPERPQEAVSAALTGKPTSSDQANKRIAEAPAQVSENRVPAEFLGLIAIDSEDQPKAPLPDRPGSVARVANSALAGRPGAFPETRIPAERLNEAPAVRIINSRCISLNFAVKDVGPSGLSSVELWHTRDCRTWTKYDGPVRQQPPVLVDVPEEGLYGFTLVARSGMGLGGEPPQPGELPQVWVEVDLTRPIVRLLNVEPGFGSKARDLLIRWSAGDKNLSLRPITLAHGEAPDGPWTTIAANLENSGQFNWEMPANTANRLYLRVEAVDVVGNLGVAVSEQPVVVDFCKPTVSIVGVEPVRK